MRGISSLWVAMLQFYSNGPVLLLGGGGQGYPHQERGRNVMYVHFTPPRYAIGTKLRVLGFPIHHEGTYVGPEGENGEDVVHCDKPDGMTLSHFDEFAAGGLRVEVVYTPGSP